MTLLVLPPNLLMWRVLWQCPECKAHSANEPLSVSVSLWFTVLWVVIPSWASTKEHTLTAQSLQIALHLQKQWKGSRASVNVFQFWVKLLKFHILWEPCHNTTTISLSKQAWKPVVFSLSETLSQSSPVGHWVSLPKGMSTRCWPQVGFKNVRSVDSP